MARQQRAQRLAALPERTTGRLDASHGSLNLRGRWMTIKDVTADLRFPSEEACRVWLKRQGIASVRRGRFILVSPIDIERALRKVG